MISLKKKVGLSLAAAAAVGATFVALAGDASVSADPKQYTDPLFGFGSDTLQDVTNAFAGYSQGVDFTPLRTANGKQIVSWDAFPAGAIDPTATDCIVTKVGTGQIKRPNGSSNGLRALSATVGGGQWPLSGTDCGGPRAMTGIVDFARSSSGPSSNPSGPIQFIPAFSDALAFAYIKPTGDPVTDLTTAQLTAIHGTGPQIIDGTVVIGCGIQTGSGTYGTWVGKIALSSGADTGTDLCNNAGGTGRLQENNSPDLEAKSLLLSSMTSPLCDGVDDSDTTAVSCENAQLIVGYSASQWIARGNGVGSPDSDLGANGGLGLINGNAAVSGTAPNLAPVAAAYESSFGRTVYYMVDYMAVEPGGEETSPAILDMFVTDLGDDDAIGGTDANADTPSKFCAAGTTIEQHGFLQIDNCGVITDALRASLKTS